MGARKIRKRRSLIHAKQSVPVVAGFPGVIAGFPDFWNKAHNQQPEFFKAAHDLVPLVNQILNMPVKGQIGIVMRSFTAIVSNSFGALITLALNGYGYDAVRIARGMYEVAVTALYLKLHPDEIDDYLDYHWVRQKSLYNYMVQHDPANLARLKPAGVAEMDTELGKVAHRFQNKYGKFRGSWCHKDLRTRAQEVGLGELYPTFYSYASAIHHGDIGGLSAQSVKESLQVDLAPSFSAAKDALMMGHNAVLSVVTCLNEVAHHGLDQKVSDACDRSLKVWKR